MKHSICYSLIIAALCTSNAAFPDNIFFDYPTSVLEKQSQSADKSLPRGEVPASMKKHLPEYVKAIKEASYPKRTYLHTILHAAAAILLVVVASFALHAWHSNKALTKYADMEIRVARGQKSDLTLPDGTRVHLNACSELICGRNFNGRQREVELIGEAYFEVAKDTTRPFIVNTEGMKVKVLGTKFNVNSYQDDGRIYAMLEAGSVEVSNGQDTQILHPRQIAYTNTWGNTSKLTVASCDPALFTGWKEGELRFRNTSLTQILKQISRCYDVTVILDHNYQEEYFSGDISYHTPLANLLQAIEASTSVRFKIEGHTVYMKKK